MATQNIDSADLKAITTGGLIREDVMNKIWDISKIPLPFTDMIGSGESASNSYKEWTVDALNDPDPDNARIDGEDAGAAVTAGGQRVGNHCQTSDKVVKVSYRADASDTIGRARELAYRLMRSQQELRRDVEAISLLNQASVPDDGSTTAGRVGGFPAWLNTNKVNRAATGFDVGGGGTNLVTVGAATVDGITLTETAIRDMMQSIYQQGGDATKLMSTPAVVRALSEYMFTSSARIGTLMSDQGQSSSQATALGSVNVFVTDFGTVAFVPNRLQLSYGVGYSSPSLTGANHDLFLIDPEYAGFSYLYGYRTDELGKTGLAENRQMAVDWTLCVNTEKAHACITSIDPTSAVTA